MLGHDENKIEPLDDIKIVNFLPVWQRVGVLE
jgi:hypothetical protein